jgi:prophage regulatory protein
MGTIRFLRLPEVMSRTGLSRTDIYRKMEDGAFPKVIPLGKRSVAWRSDEIDAWIDERIRMAEVTATSREVHRHIRRTPPVTRHRARAP